MLTVEGLYECEEEEEEEAEQRGFGGKTRNLLQG